MAQRVIEKVAKTHKPGHVQLLQVNNGNQNLLQEKIILTDSRDPESTSLLDVDELQLESGSTISGSPEDNEDFVETLENNWNITL